MTRAGTALDGSRHVPAPTWLRALRGLREALVVGVAALLSLPLGAADGQAWTVVQVVVAVLVVPLLLARRRFPMPVLAVIAALLCLGLGVPVPALVALASVAVRRSWQRAALAAALLLVAYTIGVQVGASRPFSLDAWLRGGWILQAGAVLVLGATTAVGLYVGARRQLLVSTRERAERAEAEQHLLADRARERERTRIAREMHDVLAHRLSMLALHAGALEYRADDDHELARAAGVVRENAHQALQELRDVLGVLRQDPEPDGRGPADAEGLRPQPSLGDAQRLIDESRAVSPVHAVLEGPLDGVPPATGRAAYRILQEGLTNARRHAAGAAVAVLVAAEAGRVVVEVRNAAPPAPADLDQRLRGEGSGLLGAAERAALVGGRVEHGATEEGGYVLRAELPVGAGPVPATPDATAGAPR